MEEIIEIASSTSSSGYSSDRSKNSGSSSDWSHSDFGTRNEDRGLNAEELEKAKMNRKIDRLVVKMQTVCNNFVEDTMFEVGALKDLTAESIEPMAPWQTIAGRIEDREKSQRHHARKFVRKNTRAIKTITHAVLNRKSQTTVTERMVSGETWTLGNYVLLSRNFRYKNKTRPRMMYERIAQIEEFMAIAERVKVKVFKSATDFDVTFANTYDLENLSLSTDPERDRNLRENRNLHSNGRPYSRYSNNPTFVHPYFSTPIDLSE